MTTFESACKTAYDYYNEMWGLRGLFVAKDIGDSWLLRAGEPDVVMYGMLSVVIDKKTGNFSLFELPNKKNFELLRQAVDLEIPNEYKS